MNIKSFAWLAGAVFAGTLIGVAIAAYRAKPVQAATAPATASVG